MNLLELCDPLLQYVCRINRAGRKGGGQLEYAAVRADIKALFDEMRAKAMTDARLNQQYKLIEMPLVFFVDSMISESALPLAQKWNSARLAYEQNELAGDEKFFDLLEENMKDQGDDASERLAVYYTCLGLGFTGWYMGQPEYLRKRMLEIAPRIRKFIESDTTIRLCPEGYENIDTSDLVQPPSRKMVYIALVCLGFCVATIACSIYLFNKNTDDLTEALRKIKYQERNLGIVNRG